MFGALAGAVLPSLITGGFGLMRGQQDLAAGRQYRDASAQMANAQLAASRDRLANEVMMNRDMAKFNMAGRIGDRTAAYGYGGDLEFGRQQRARRQELGEFGDMARAQENERMRFGRDFGLSGRTQELNRNQSRRKMKEALASQLAAGRGMFGPIAPVNVDSMVV